MFFLFPLRRQAFFSLCLIAFSADACAARSEEITHANPTKALFVQYPKVQDKHERDFDPYFLELLTLALDKSNTPYSLSPATIPVMVESRSDLTLQKNRSLVLWLNSNAQREDHLNAIKVPLFKGLIGWRLLLIRKNDQATFSKIQSLKELSAFVAGQGHDWPDTEILKLNQLTVSTSSSWDGLFEMLKLKRIDYFPRSVIEVERELRLFSELNLYVENSLALHYPAAYYFFVNKHNSELASAIERGLKLMIENGDFDKIFNKYFESILKNAKLDERRILHLERNLEFPLDSVNLWYEPQLSPNRQIEH